MPSFRKIFDIRFVVLRVNRHRRCAGLAGHINAALALPVGQNPAQIPPIARACARVRRAADRLQHPCRAIISDESVQAVKIGRRVRESGMLRRVEDSRLRFLQRAEVGVRTAVVVAVRRTTTTTTYIINILYTLLLGQNVRITFPERSLNVHRTCCEQGLEAIR